MWADLTAGIKPLCPKCRVGRLYPPGFHLDVVPVCPNCGLEIGRNDSADGPAVFLIFLLGFALVPLAVLVDVLLSPPLWAHAVIWTVAALGITIGLLRPLKALVIYLQYKHRKTNWGE
jgi:uncharacterized protein (DUF983 family)